MCISRIACIGDSLTFGYLVENRIQNCYPAVLEQMFDGSCSVKNFGVNGLTMLKSGAESYWNNENFQSSLAFNPDIVIIMLGTNDSKSRYWTGIFDYARDYEEMVACYQKLKSNPKIYLMTPPPAFVLDDEHDIAFGISNDHIQEMCATIKEIAKNYALSVIDLNKILTHHPEYFPVDGVHTNSEGAKMIAQIVYQKLCQNNKNFN